MELLSLKNEFPDASLQDDMEHLRLLDERLLWLSSWTVHNANNIRPSRDGLKVGGHQASCASMTTMMAALYFRILRKNDRVAVKPHASPVYHAAQYLLGRQSKDQLEKFRAFGGAQSYPSRTKDKDDVDFSTGSVGLGVAITSFAALVQDYLISHGRLAPEERGRMISLLGDAELDEGNIYEALIEAYKHDIRDTWWIVDYNRQSLDSTTSDRMFDRFDGVFQAMGWQVVTLKYGKKQRAAFSRPGGPALKEWIENAPNDLYAALSYSGGAAWRRRLDQDIGALPDVKTLLDAYSDDELALLMTELGGHCMESIVEAMEAVEDDRPRLFIAYTMKGYRLPFQGHKDNHAGLMNERQVNDLKASLNIAEGEEWSKWAGLGPNAAASLENYVSNAPLYRAPPRRRSAPKIEPPPIDSLWATAKGKISTQAAFGKILHNLAKGDHEFASRIVTTSPDVSVSTNLGAFINQRGVFSRREKADLFHESKIPSPQKWMAARTGQHIELGIAENNLFLLLAALGLSEPLFGQRCFPIGTLYDPFIARGLDALNYACYQDARFMLVATPSGLTLGPEGGAHQSINSPLIGMSQPSLTYFEPSYADELPHIMRWAFDHLQAEEGGSVYLRLTTRAIEQPERGAGRWSGDMLKGAYWLREPAAGAAAAIAAAGALAPEALDAYEQLLDDIPGLGVLSIPSADRLYADWTRSRRSRWTAEGASSSHIDRLLASLAPGAALITVVDGASHTLSWLGAVRGHRVYPLGVENFGQVGDLPDLYAHYRLDADAIIDACAEACLRE